MLADRALRSIVALHDLPHLVAALGHTPLWEPLDATALSLGRLPPPRAAAIVGHLESFTWYAVATDDPARYTPRVARRLTERGRLCGVFGLDGESRCLAISVAVDGNPMLVVDLDRPTRLATSCLGRIGATRTGGPLGIASRTAEALSGAGLGRHFFASFRATLDRFTNALPSTIPERHRHELALLQLTRVLFLYFVQAKGWLDGSDHFLRGHVDDCLFHRRPIHRSLLLPLFFGSLNQPPHQRRGRALTFGRIPFLNGGLFEPQRLERRYRPEVPDPVWRDAFDTLFERYHFTLAADTPGSIAPDMLGRVFEGVMAPEARKRSGTFYTPRALVRTVIDAALAGFVGGELGIADAEALERLEAGNRPAVRLLQDITILDPAVGSGAFLLGALDRLLALRRGAGEDIDARRIVARNLYGVDLNPAAVQLAELRLWLAVVHAEPDGAPELVEPLPNLEAFVRQGDTLSDPLRLMLRHPLRQPRHADALATARRAAAAASGDAKREALRLLRHLELKIAADRLDAAIAERESQIRTLLAPRRDPTLFGECRGLDRRTRKSVQLARKELTSLRESRRQIYEDGMAPAFDFDTHFGDVTSRGGFDIVIGNPPWVRAEGLAPRARAELRDRFEWWRAGEGRGYSHQPDLAVAFLERGWELTRPGGILAMLVPSKIATAAYGAVARAALTDRGTLLAVADLDGTSSATFEATTYPLALVVRSHRAPDAHHPRLGLHPSIRTSLPASEGPGAPWILQPEPLHRALRRLRKIPALSETLRVQLGVKTGANHLFLDPPPDVEQALVRPALHGKDVYAFGGRPSSRILWTHDAQDQPLGQLPAGATRHFDRHRSTLRRRSDDKGDVPWALFRASAGRRVPRVVWADLSPRLEVLCLTAGPERDWVPLNSCYVIRCSRPDDALGLCAWLNSTWIRAAARATADPASGGYARFNTRAVGAVPLPPGVVGDSALGELARRGAAGEDVQAQLDAYVGEWLAIDTGDRRALSEVVGVGTPRRR